MSSGHRSVIGRGIWRIMLAAGVLAAAAAAPSAALAAHPSPSQARSALVAGAAAVPGTPTQVIDATTDPQLAGQTLNAGCADISNCSWNPSMTPITIGYGPPSVLGDALYNCSDEAYAETAVGISDEVAESTSLSETLSVEVKLGFLGFEESTAEFQAFSKQSTTFSKTVTSVNAVAVPPMWKGWNETEVLTGFASGDAYITDGIKLIEVQNIDLSFPGYRNPNDTTDTPVKYIGYRTPMTAQDITSRCGAISGLGGARLGATPPASFKLTLCTAVPAAGLGSVPGLEPRRLIQSRCASRKVLGTSPPAVSQATATVTRAGRTYAAGTDTGGRIRLTVSRPITAGRYTLTVSQPVTASQRGRRTQTELATIVPIAIQ